MSKLKILILIMMLSLLCSCSVDYTIEINNENKINEKIMVDVDRKNISIDDLSYMNIVEEYKTSDLTKKYFITQKNEIYNGNYVYKDFEDYRTNSKFSNQLTPLTEGDITKLDFELNLSEYLLPGKDYESMLIDDIKVNIRLPYKVINNNAEIVKNNSYTWKFDKDDYVKKISIEYNTNSTDNLLSNKNLYVLIFLGIFLIIVVGIGIYFVGKSKEINKL